MQALAIPYVSLTVNDDKIWAELENDILVFFDGKDDIEYKVAAFAETLRSAGDIQSGYFDVSNPERIVYSASLPGDEDERTEENQVTENEDEPVAEE